MLPSSKRLTVPLFKEVMDKGKLFHSPYFSVKFLKMPGISRFSVAISKKVAKNAVDRNKLRRRIYSALRSLDAQIPTGFHGVFMAKAPVIKSTLPTLIKEAESIFVKSGIIK
jgi:ribonuclease P protein component